MLERLDGDPVESTRILGRGEAAAPGCGMGRCPNNRDPAYSQGSLFCISVTLSLLLELGNERCLEALGSLFHIELDAVALVQVTEALGLDG
jgi:hypothetical protein